MLESVVLYKGILCDVKDSWTRFKMILLDTFVQIKEQHRGDQMTPGPKSQLLSGIVVDTIPGPVSIFTISTSICGYQNVLTTFNWHQK